MIRNSYKWVKRCLGWIVVGFILLGGLTGLIVDRSIGYGTVEPRVTWKGEVYPPDRLAAGSPRLRLQGRPQAWEPGKVFKVRPGPVCFDLELKDFHPCSVTANVIKDGRAVAEFRLEAEPRSMRIETGMTNVLVNGQPCGAAWVLTNAEVRRTYQIEARAPGYHTNSLALEIRTPGEDLTTNLIWRPLMGFVSVRINAAADKTTCFMDNVPLDAVRGGFVRAGAHVLSVSNADYYPWSQRVEVVHGGTNDFVVVLKPKLCLLSLVVTPAVEYQLRDITGNMIAVNSGQAELIPGTNTLVVSAEHFTSRQKDFVLEPNRKYTWTVELEKQGAENFRKAKAEFDHLTRESNWAQLEQYGGDAWQVIRDAKYNEVDLIRGAQQYSDASAALPALIERCNKAYQVQMDKEKILQAEFSKEKERFEELVTAGKQYPILEKCVDWQSITAESPNHNPVTGAQHYRDGVKRLEEIIATVPERQALKKREEMMNNSICALATWRTGSDDAAWAKGLNKATQLLRQYEKEFGTRTRYEEWFGSIGTRVEGWKNQIDYEWQLLGPKFQKKRN